MSATSSPARLVRGLLLSCHPGPSAAVTVLSGLLTVAAGGGAWLAARVALAVLAGQLSIGWSNDWLDAARDIAVGRRDKPVASHLATAGSVRTAAVVAAVMVVPLSFSLGLRAGLAHLVTVGGGWAYNLWLKSSVWSWLPYAVSFGVLPSVAVLSLPDHHIAAWWVTATGALLGVGAHLTNALPDLEQDRATGIVGLPHRLGRRRAGVVAPVLLFAASLLVVFSPAGAVSALGWAGLVAGVAVLAAAAHAAAARPASRAPFVASIVVALIDVVLLVFSGSALVG